MENFIYTKQKTLFDPDTLQIFFGALLWAIAVYIVIAPSGTLPGNDIYFHVQISNIMKDQGLVLKSFPWTTHSVWNNAFFDKDWLFHVLIIPFLTFGKIAGAKAALVIFVFVIGIAWGGLFKVLKCKNIFLIMLLTLFCSGWAFPGRLILLRAHLFSIFFLGVVLLCIIESWYLGLTAITVLYSLSYTGSWQVLPVAVIFDLSRYFQRERSSEDKAKLRYFTLWAILGLFIGLLINPYYPANISGGIIQNIIVLKSSWFGTSGAKIILGEELYSTPIKDLATIYLPVIIIMFASFYHCINYRANTKNNFAVSLSLGILSLMYFLLTLLTVKFTDYFIPVTIAFAASTFNTKIPLKGKKSAYTYIVLCLIIIYGSFCLIELRKSTSRSKPLFNGAVEWLNKNIQTPKKNDQHNKLYSFYDKYNKFISLNNNDDKKQSRLTIFTGNWSDPPALFYGAPQFSYLVFLDPNFMYAFSPDKYNLWQKISDGVALYPALRIYDDFNSNIVFLTKNRKGLINALKNSPYAKLKYTGPDDENIFIIDIPYHIRRKLNRN